MNHEHVGRGIGLDHVGLKPGSQRETICLKTEPQRACRPELAAGRPERTCNGKAAGWRPVTAWSRMDFCTRTSDVPSPSRSPAGSGNACEAV